MKNLLLIAGLAGMFAMASCGGKKDKDAEVKDSVKTPTAKEICKTENNISMTIKGYNYSMTGKFEFEAPKFEVKQSTYNYVNDSLAELKLCNYMQNELVGDRKDEQIDIVCEFHTKKGQKLAPGTYKYNDYESPMWARVTMVTSKGTVWFNWSMGMPEQGSVKIDFIDNANICGNFNLNVEKPDVESIGLVRLNGTFSVLK